ncbi:unnamed protein product [Eruca vesicaria subsp. sativa]|uniref:Pectinesterase catalytic domain-containing protein n=1 Tax=Eruca vesicaria subsp. sativa TaxID=29727 RepID=A0ABC8M6F7_ERUVS|nr:unnamed protein product [Eruca vesicaria subsp. sativa]
MRYQVCKHHLTGEVPSRGPYSKSNHPVLFRCAFDGYQDTLYAHVGEQLYRECDILGTVDFFAAAVFHMCTIRTQDPVLHRVVTVTTQGAEEQNENYGFSIISSKILAYEGEEFIVVAYLGSPRKSHATVVVMETNSGI